MSRTWDIDIRRKEDNTVNRVVYSRSGMMGNEKCDGAIEVECHKQYNGSGRSAFGGLSSWPCISITIPFGGDREEERDRIANLLRRFIDKEIL